MSTDSNEKYQKACAEFTRLSQIGPSQRLEGSLDKARIELEEAWQEHLQEVDRQTSEMLRLIGLRAIEAENRIKPNPLLTWEAFQYCRENKIPLPEWILLSLEKMAEKLLSIKPAKDIGWDIVNALGLKPDGGQGSFFWRYERTKFRIKTVSKVMRRIEENKEDVFTACESVADELKQNGGNSYSGKTISTWYYELKKAFNSSPI